MQRIVIDKLKNDTGVYYHKIYRNPNLLPCLQLKKLAEEFLKTLNLNENDFDKTIDR